MHFARSARSKWLMAAAVLALAVLGACAGARRPDLARLYHDWAARDAGRRPVVVIHGLMGSRLVESSSGRVVWGRLRGLLGGSIARRLGLSLLPGEQSALEARGFVRQLGGVDVYGSILNILEQQGGYLRADKQTPPYQRATCFPFFYDWRLDNAHNAARLGAKIAAIRDSYGDPDLQVDIVAHSMGGLIARYYALYGSRDVLDQPQPRPDYAGSAAIHRLVMLGTPNLGSTEALVACIQGDRIGLTRVPPEELATMPAMYQVMPAPQVGVIHDEHGRTLDIDIYRSETWEEFGWGLFDPRQQQGIRRRYQRSGRAARESYEDYRARLKTFFSRQLERSRGFHRALAAGPLPSSISTLLLGGDCTPTLRALVLEGTDSGAHLRTRPEAVRHPDPSIEYTSLFFEPGDGTVTKSSLLGRLPGNSGGHGPLRAASVVFICEEHRKLTANLTFQDNLLHALLYEPVSATEACGADRSTR